MSDEQIRPEAESFDCQGARVRIVDPAGILLAATGPEEIELLHGAAFPGPIRGVTIRAGSRISDEGPSFAFSATVRRGGGLDTVKLGLTGPVGVMIAKQLATRDPLQFASKTALLAQETIRQLGLRPGQLAPGPQTLADAVSGIQATVTYTEETVTAGPVTLPQQALATITAVLPRRADEDLTPQLRGFVTLVFEVVATMLGGPLTGRTYVLSHHRQAAPAPPEGETSAAVTLDQVGGLEDIVAQLREVAISFAHPEAMARWGARRPQGILLYGPPGTGKTMLATALANEIGATLKEIRTPEILDKWLGASERNIKRIFGEARRYTSPTVLLFDEFDSIISYTGGGQDAAGQAINSVAGIFKQEMNTLVEENPRVIVVATTNFPQRVDESLIRSGRFDIKLAVPKPDEAGRAEIIAKMIRRLIATHETDGFRMFAGDVDPRALAAACPGASGADLKEALRRTQLAKAMEEARGLSPSPISQGDLLRSLLALGPT